MCYVLSRVISQREDDFHLFPRLPDVPEIVDDHAFVTCVALDQAAQLEVALGGQQLLHQHLAAGEEHAVSSPHQFLADGLEHVRLSRSR